MTGNECKERLKKLNCLVVIPTYNNAGTICQVVQSVRVFAEDILIVNDGSTDQTKELIAQEEGIETVSYVPNRGKGFAIKKAFEFALAKDFRYIITIDADGQHFADDLPVFVEAIEQNQDTLLVGARNLEAENMAQKNTFANKFSNFWFKVETGETLTDTQSGYRLYPIQLLRKIHFFTNRYEFEVEVLVRSVWNNIRVRNIPIKVYYPPTEQRVSHFRPFHDFTRISILNTVLFTTAILWYYPTKLIKKCL